MSTQKAKLSRLAEIGQERVSLIARLQVLETEQTGIVAELAQVSVAPSPTPTTAPPMEAEATPKPRRRKGLVPLPVGRSIKRNELDALKAQIAAMDSTAFVTQGRTFVHEWYPKLAKTPAWHEISTALQKHFGARRQAIAAYAAHVATANGHEHVQSAEQHA